MMTSSKAVLEDSEITERWQQNNSNLVKNCPAGLATAAAAILTGVAD